LRCGAEHQHHYGQQFQVARIGAVRDHGISFSVCLFALKRFDSE
jgi:hypothetical protein